MLKNVGSNGVKFHMKIEPRDWKATQINPDSLKDKVKLELCLIIWEGSTWAPGTTYNKGLAPPFEL